MTTTPSENPNAPRAHDPLGRVAVVTGGGTGIGAAIARHLVRAGASVAVFGRNPEPLERLAAALAEEPVDVLAVPVDITEDRAVHNALAFVAASLGPVEILVNNAGSAPSAPLGATDDELFDRTLRLNVRAPFVLTKAVLPSMKQARFGRIVNVASTAALRGYRFTSAYTASKHALAGLTRSLSAELLPFGITVNAVAPGFVDTGIVAAAAQRISERTERSQDEARDILAAMNPLQRFVTPEEVAAAVVGFLGSGAGAISGQCLIVDGGTQPM